VLGFGSINQLYAGLDILKEGQSGTTKLVVLKKTLLYYDLVPCLVQCVAVCCRVLQ